MKAMVNILSIEEFLMSELLNMMSIGKSCSYSVKSASQKSLLVAGDMSLTDSEMSDFEYRMAMELQERFGMDEKEAQENVSWFVDRCVIHGQGR